MVKIVFSPDDLVKKFSFFFTKNALKSLFLNREYWYDNGQNRNKYYNTGLFHENGVIP